MKTLSGIGSFDDILEGGYQNGNINMIYGPGASGKTTFCLCLSISLAKQGKKVLFIDSENSLSLKRLEQLSSGLDFEKILENIVIIKPKGFLEQHKVINNLNSLIEKSNISAVIIDTIGFHYRSENKDGNINSKMARQLANLKYFAAQKNIPVLITNQVYSDINKDGKINVVGGDMVRNWCSCVVELQKNRNRKLIISKPFNKESKFEIRIDGVFLI